MISQFARRTATRVANASAKPLTVARFGTSGQPTQVPPPNGRPDWTSGKVSGPFSRIISRPRMIPATFADPNGLDGTIDMDTEAATKPFWTVPWQYEATMLDTYPRTEVTSLSNGVRVATEQRTGQTATVGVWIDAGSRYETAETNGTAHFLEHMFFKGTKNRTRLDIEKGIENMGGHLNAYTSREQTVFYAQCFAADVEENLDILSDIIQNSNYTEEDIERERNVILQEYDSVQAQTEEVIFDRLHETAFRRRGEPGTQALGATILGPVENIKSIKRDDIEAYVKTHYTGDRMVVAYCGPASHADVVAMAEAKFGLVPSQPPADAQPVQMEPAVFTGSSLTIRNDDDARAHVAFAFPTGGWQQDTFPLLVVQALLGSWDQSNTGGVHSTSSLIRACATDQLAYSMMTFNTQYKDTGLFGVYGVCENTTLQMFMWHVTKAFCRLSTEPIADERLEAAKNQVKVNMLSSLDTTTATAEDIGRQMLTFGRRLHPTELVHRIDAVDEAAIQDVADRLFYDNDFALSAIGPLHELPDYSWLRRRTYMLRR